MNKNIGAAERRHNHQLYLFNGCLILFQMQVAAIIRKFGPCCKSWVGTGKVVEVVHVRCSSNVAEVLKVTRNDTIDLMYRSSSVFLMADSLPGSTQESGACGFLKEMLF
eukprot:scaffold213444_cov19-Tisochrysis_lutea.AAC.2